jgi:hypothetical protein
MRSGCNELETQEFAMPHYGFQFFGGLKDFDSGKALWLFLDVNKPCQE